MPLTVALIGVPSALGAPESGPDLGPATLRAANLVARLTALGVDVRDFGDVSANVSGMGGVPGLRGVDVLAARARESVHLALDAELFPIVLGGEHSVALAAIAGASKFYPNLGVIWVDAHPDFNTLETSPTGNPHGMALALAAGIGPEAARKRLGRSPLAQPSRIAVVGARSIDPGEEVLLDQEEVRVWTTHDLTELGGEQVAIDVAGRMFGSEAEAVHLSIDLDVLDPGEWPGVSTPVAGGIPLEELLILVTAIIQHCNVVSLDVVELNPNHDVAGRTAEAGVRVIETAAQALLEKPV